MEKAQERVSQLVAPCWVHVPSRVQSTGNHAEWWDHAAVPPAVQMKGPIIPISKNPLVPSGRRTHTEVGALCFQPVGAPCTVPLSQDLAAALPAASSLSTGLPAPRAWGKCALWTPSRHGQSTDVGWSDTRERGHSSIPVWLKEELAPNCLDEVLQSHRDNYFFVPAKEHLSTALSCVWALE